MSKRQWIMLFGVWVIIYQFLGFPASWIKILGVATGVLICFVAYRLNQEVSINGDDMTHVEHKNVSEPQTGGKMSDFTNTNSQS